MSKYLMILFFALATIGQSRAATFEEDFSGKSPKVKGWESRWMVADGVLKTKDGQSTYSSFKVENGRSNACTISFRCRQLAANPKGSLFGCKVSAGNGSQLHLFYQNGLARCIVKAGNRKIPTQNLGKLAKALPVGSDTAASLFVFKVTPEQVSCQVDNQQIGVIKLPPDWRKQLPISGIEFHTYQLDAEFDDIKIVAENTGKIVAQPGDERLSQLDVKEKMKVAKDANAYRILYIGDSITRHGFSKGTIAKLGWDHLAGMAASTEDKDYAHLVAARIQRKLPDRKVHVYFHSKGGSGAAAHRLSAIDEFAQVEPHLVVVQLGEHEKEKNGKDALKQNYGELLRKIQAWPNHPKIICTGVWNPYQAGTRQAYTRWSRTVENTMSGVCKELGIPFASVEKYALNPECSGSGTSPGVKWHPNDKGMEGYAEAIFKCFETMN